MPITIYPRYQSPLNSTQKKRKIFEGHHPPFIARFDSSIESSTFSKSLSFLSLKIRIKYYSSILRVKTRSNSITIKKTKIGKKKK